MTTRILFLVVGLSISSLLSAQDNLSWKKHAKLADDLYKEGKYAEAANHYEQAWKKKDKKKDLIFNAGECYYLVKDYRKAADAYRNVKDDSKDFPLVGLKYARSLKQDGQYDKAKSAFQEFFDKYTGESKNILEDIIKTEVAGCELGMKLPLQLDKNFNLQYPGTGVNSTSSEFAPFAFSDDVLYYSSTMGGKARIYRSQKQGEQWSKGTTPENFPVIQNDQHFCNGFASPDGNRFYFTICSGAQNWGDLTSRCEIFVIKRRGNTWSQPERLPDFINMAKTTSTHPNVVHQGGREILYFVSNRDGGRGSMDIWYTSRDLTNENSEFSSPINLGGIVNTLGDEITPFYDVTNGTLYFASNGQIAIGGFDVFTSKGDGTRWSPALNAGMPINSSADDFSYVKNKSGMGGFLVSNRVFGSQKTSTRDEDIFVFGESGDRRISLRGSIYDQSSGAPAPPVTVSLYELSGGNEAMMEQKLFDEGSYAFDIQSGKNYKVVVQGEGYDPYNLQFATDDPELYVYGQPVYLIKSIDRPTQPVKDPEVKEEISTKEGESYIIKDEENFSIVTTAPRHTGVYYRVQMIALKKYNSDDKAFSVVKEMGTLVTEYITERELTRVLLGDYFNQQEAIAALDLVKQHGFKGAYIIQYEDGVRQGRVKL
ncbi:MAG: PD40 domain-containing protein [Saprospiraceae bacterium]|nr:PD40 domain-containing protein [Saprospiraceae bacterium]